MNTIATHNMTSPYNKIEECAKFVVEDVYEKFVLSEVYNPGQQYTFSFWVRSETAGNIVLDFTDYATSSTWNKYVITFTPTAEYILLRFSVAGTYYIYHPKLELGDKATDWTPAIEDVDADISNVSDTADAAQEAATNNATRINKALSTITQLADSIAMLVRDENGASLMTQTETGWSFDISKITNSLGKATMDIQTLTESLGGVNNTVNTLNQAVNDLGVLTDYVIITTYNDQPCIELGESENNFKLRITNTAIQFVEGSAIPAYINNQKLMIENAEVTNELHFGNFVWKVRGGNMGLIWKGASS